MKREVEAIRYYEPKHIRLDYCIYCNTSLPATNHEHIFNSCWTGKHKTGSLICNECNAAFAPEVDKAFIPYTQYHMNVWSLKNSRRNEVPTIETNDGILIRPGAIPESKSSISLMNNGNSINIKASAKSRGALKRIIKDAFKDEMNREIEDVELQRLLAGKVVKQVPSEMVELSATIDPQLETRSVVHTILKCMAMFDTNFKVNAPKHILNFSRYGAGSWESFAVRIQTLGIDVETPFSNRFISYNAVQVHYLKQSGLILGKLTILRDIHRWVLLSTEYKGPSKVLFVAEPSYAGELVKLIVLSTDIEKLAENTKIAGPLTIHNIAESLVNLSQKSLGPDAIIVKLSESIKEIFGEERPVTIEMINEYKKALEHFVSKITVMIGFKDKFLKMPKKVHERMLTESYFPLIEEKLGSKMDMALINKSINMYLRLSIEYVTGGGDNH